MRWTEAGRRIAGGAVTAALCLVAGAAAAQTSIRQTWGDGTDATSRLNRAAPAAALASSSGFSDPGPSATRVMAQPTRPGSRSSATSGSRAKAPPTASA
jgi:hypothetical protein